MSFRGLAGVAPIPALVTTFNSLARNPKVPSGLVENVWHISVRHVPLNPPGYLLFFVNPESHYVHVEGPLPSVNGNGEILDLESTEASLMLARFLLNGFVKDEPPMNPRIGKPWKWITNDAALGERLTSLLRRFRVGEEELLSMPVGSDAENRGADEDWEGFYRQLTGQLRQ